LLADDGAPFQVTKDICWQADVKKLFKKDTADLLNQYFSALKASDIAQRHDSVMDIATSPRHISADNFGMTSIDVEADHAACSASLTVTINTKRHGNVVVADQTVEFQLKREESGEMVVVNMQNLMGFVQALGGQLDAMQ